MYDITIDNEQWWQDTAGFFGKDYLEADDSFDGFVSDNKSLVDRTNEEVSGVIKLTGLPEHGTLLDCPSGYGRHSLELGRRGVQVTGCDINSEFLQICNDKREAEHLDNVRFIKKSMLELEFHEEFNAVINMFYSFGFFDEEGNERTAKNFYNALKPGGTFLMHTHVTVPRFEKKLIKEYELRTLKSGKKLELYRFLNPENSREDGKWTLVDENDNRKELTHYSVRIYTREEYEALCKKVGFSKVDFYSTWDGAPYYDEADMLIAVATK